MENLKELFENLNRHYLKIEEIGYIISEMKKYKTYVEREICKVVLVAKYLTGENFKGVSNIDLYNQLIELGIVDDLESIIVNYYSIDYGFREEISTDLAVNDFLNSLTSVLTKFEKKMPKNFDLKKAMSELKSANDELNKG